MTATAEAVTPVTTDRVTAVTAVVLTAAGKAST